MTECIMSIQSTFRELSSFLDVETLRFKEAGYLSEFENVSY